MIKPSVVIRTEPRIVFDVSKPAFNWLKALMQNPLYEDESEEEADFRKEFFTAMHRVDTTAMFQTYQELDDIPF